MDTLGQAPREDDDNEIPIDEVDMSSEVSAATFKTFVSGVSDCTNMTFNKVKKHWEQNASKHKVSYGIFIQSFLSMSIRKPSPC